MKIVFFLTNDNPKQTKKYPFLVSQKNYVRATN